jgi:hypothetical protein
MTSGPTVNKKPAADPVLRCLNGDCSAMLAYEVNAENALVVDLAYTARRDGDLRFFPCPKCGGRNVVEEFIDAKGKPGHRVTRFEAAPK